MENFERENIDELLEICQYFPPSKFCAIRYLDVMAEVEIVAVDKCSETSDSSTVSRSSKGVKQAMFYCWKYRHYFEVIDEGDKNLKAHCTLCSPSAKPLSCARNTTSNIYIQFTKL